MTGIGAISRKNRKTSRPACPFAARTALRRLFVVPAGCLAPPALLARLSSPALLSSLALLSFLTACAQLAPPPPETRRVAVLDFATPAELGRESRQPKGWWFGSRVVHENRRAGVLFADALADALGGLKYLDARPRGDLKTYFVEKRQMLAARFPGFSKKDYDQMLSEMTPLDFGTDLGVDQVLTGEILESCTSYFYFPALWRTRVRVRVDLWDVWSQRLEWSREFTKKKWCLSQWGTMQSLGRTVAEELEKTHYRAARE